jgi:hypothetical protein
VHHRASRDQRDRVKDLDREPGFLPISIASSTDATTSLPSLDRLA